jgi:hypothetical protein
MGGDRLLSILKVLTTFRQRYAIAVRIGIDKRDFSRLGKQHGDGCRNNIGITFR